MTTKLAARLLDESVLALKERKRAFDFAWLWSVFIIFGAIGVPWFFHVLDIELSRVVWSVFGYALLYRWAATATDRLRSRRALSIALAVLQGSAVLFLAILWHLVGGLNTPAFLAVFFLPVLTSGALLLGRQTLRLAVLSVVSVAVIALCESTDLRWYFDQFGAPVRGLFRLLPAELPGRPDPIPGLETPPAFQFLLLEMFTVLMLLAAFAARSLGAQTLRLLARLERSVRASEDPAELFAAVLQAQPVPTVLLYADTRQVLLASRSFVNQMLLRPEELPGKTLFDLLAFSDPNAVRRLIAGGSRTARFCAYRIGEERRVAKIRVHRMTLGDETYASVSLEDQDELFYLSTAFEEMEEPLIILDADRRVAYSNPAASQVFGEIHFGMEAAPLLMAPDKPPDWWEVDGEDGAEIPIELRGRSFLLRTTRSGSSGDGLVILNFRPAGTRPSALLTAERTAS